MSDPRDVTDAFRLVASDGDARAGLLRTAHGLVHTPVFMPVGTKATVKATTAEELLDLGAQVVLANTYHLVLRPGAERIAAAGGLHRVMRWPRPILTDSGGYQVFSMRDISRLDDDGVEFRSIYDGDLVRFTPESVARSQAQLGSDIAMVLDECPPGDADRAAVERAVARTTAWAARAREEHLRVRRGPDDAGDSSPSSRWSRTGLPQLQFGIVQGGTHADLRERSTRDLLEIGFDGYAVGGLSVGEDPALTMPALESATALLPVDAARYYMGIGDPVGLLDVIHRGIDMFDCVLPTRLGRTATALVPREVDPRCRLNLRAGRWAEDPEVIQPGCACPACAGGYPRRYLQHLFRQQELLAMRMTTLHNVHVLVDLVTRARRAIAAGEWSRGWYERERERWSRDLDA